MIDKDDWRLHGQENYLKGIKLYYKIYKPYKDGWEHDHCEFCWQKFTESGDCDSVNIGYTTENYYRWICIDCFNDFKEMFHWQLGE